jgi:hypothetical protein
MSCQYVYSSGGPLVAVCADCLCKLSDGICPNEVYVPDISLLGPSNSQW